MADLATIPFARSLPNDWNIANHARLKLSQRPLASAVSIKLGRRVDLELITAKLGHELPAVNRYCTQRDGAWLWQGPKEWLVLSEARPALTQLQLLEAELGDATVVALDVTDRTLILRMAGPLATQLIAKGTTLHASLLTEVVSCRTKFANLHATIFRSGDDSYDLIVDRANAVYLHNWLRRSVQDLGVG